MKPDTKSVYFRYSLAAFVLYFALLLVLRNYATHIVKSGDEPGNHILVLSWLSIALVGVGASFWYKSSRPAAPMTKQLLVLLLAPVVLAPLLGLLQALIVLQPLYSLASNSL